MEQGTVQRRTGIVKNSLLALTLLAGSTMAMAETLPFSLDITGSQLNVHRSLKLSDLGEGHTAVDIKFKDNNGKAYAFTLNYKALPKNRSFPGNLDITLKDAQGKKLAYLFFAINRVRFLKQMAVFGLMAKNDGALIDVRFTFDKHATGKLRIADLGEERFVQDTLVPKLHFQMIRPVLVPLVKPGLRAQTFLLDAHPYGVNYSLKDQQNGMVEFQYNLYDKSAKQTHLLERIYYQAGSLNVLREAMFAGKYFHPDDGVFKLVFYPAMGQTEPEKIHATAAKG